MAHARTTHPRIPVVLGLLGLLAAAPLGCIQGDSSTDGDIELRITLGPPTSTGSFTSAGSTGPSGPTGSFESTGLTEPDSWQTTSPSDPCYYDCPGDFVALGLADGDQMKCWCSRNRQGGDAYGTDIYAENSDICKAAKHAGVIVSNGYVEITASPSIPEYTPSYRYNIQSHYESVSALSYAVTDTTCP